MIFLVRGVGTEVIDMPTVAYQIAMAVLFCLCILVSYWGVWLLADLARQ